VLIRPATSHDELAVGILHIRAFGGPDEATLVARLRADEDIVASLVAEEDGIVVANIVFSRVVVETADNRIDAVALAPMAVDPDRQRRGIGSALVREGLRVCQQAGESIVVVVGHPAYYPRFGFSPALAVPLRNPFGTGDAVMALELRPGALRGVEGEVRYPPAFDRFT